MTDVKTWLPVLCFSMIIATVTTIITNQLLYPPQKIAMVNVNAIMDHYIQQMARSTLDNGIIEANTKKFARRLEQEIDLLSKEKNVALLVSEAVLNDVPDYTIFIQKRIEN